MALQRGPRIRNCAGAGGPSVRCRCPIGAAGDSYGINQPRGSIGWRDPDTAGCAGRSSPHCQSDQRNARGEVAKLVEEPQSPARRPAPASWQSQSAPAGRPDLAARAWITKVGGAWRWSPPDRHDPVVAGHRPDAIPVCCAGPGCCRARRGRFVMEPAAADPRGACTPPDRGGRVHGRA